MITYKTDDLFGVPDNLNLPNAGSPKKVTRKRQPPATSQAVNKAKATKPRSEGVATPAPALPGQGFLPGLSRRGRPRLAKPISAVERTAEHRRKRLENGAKRVEIILDSEVFRFLDLMAEHHKEPRSEVIATLIRKAASRLKL